jgi:dihydropteroate synthase
VKLRLRDRVLELRHGEPLVMGIVNASPESFSDGDGVGGLESQVERALTLVEDGAHLIDVGGESGVTDREPVTADEEASRVVPLVERLVGAGLTVSVDTWKAPVAHAAVAAGAAMINDVSGLREVGVADACAESGAALVVMHTRVPPKVKEFPGYDDVGADVVSFIRSRVEEAMARGVGEDQIVVDPGPDFGKRPAETVEALRRLPELGALGYPMLLAVSRKDFVGALTARSPAERLGGTLAALGEGVDAGAAIVRVHDVAAVNDFLTVRGALRGRRAVDPDLALDPALRREHVRSRMR